MPHILYLSYDGMTDTLGESQVLAYAAPLSEKGYTIHLLSFEKPALYQQEGQRIAAFCEAHGLYWHPQTYHKQPPVLSTLQDIRQMKRVATRLHRQYDFQGVHCRGYISGLVGLHLKQKAGIPYLFDMRGFWPDEKRDSGAWKAPWFKPVYRYFKRMEIRLFAQAKGIVSLTQAGKSEIVQQGWSSEEQIGGIPTCVDFDVFPAFSPAIREEVRTALGIPPDAKVLLYSGSLGGNYDLRIPFTIFEQFRKAFPDGHFLILSRSDPGIVADYLREKALPEAFIHIATVPFPEVHRYLMAGDAGLIFYGKGYSNIGRSPTKLGEYWACGLPVLSLSGIGDVDHLLRQYPENGSLIQDLDPAHLKRVWNTFPFGAPKAQMRKDAMAYYALEKGVAFYQQTYQKLIAT